MEADIGTICVSGEGEQGGTRRVPPHSPPPLLLLHSEPEFLKKLAGAKRGDPRLSYPVLVVGF